ncbi:MAG TPA: Flp family type IVb pilin [Pilimelia sp.]|nr:Flp family type IVb pilin [Pilimelia sp.]
MLAYLASLMSSRTRSDRGVTAVEYGLMVALIAAVAIGAVIMFSGTVNGLFGDVASDPDGAMP